MNPEQLRLTTMDPVTRSLVRLVLVDPDDECTTDEIFYMMLTRRRAADRRLWLTRRGAEAPPRFDLFLIAGAEPVRARAIATSTWIS
jgi:DNA gyrase/topoisomerase IV subunit B